MCVCVCVCVCIPYFPSKINFPGYVDRFRFTSTRDLIQITVNY